MRAPQSRPSQKCPAPAGRWPGPFVLPPDPSATTSHSPHHQAHTHMRPVNRLYPPCWRGMSGNPVVLGHLKRKKISMRRCIVLKRAMVFKLPGDIREHQLPHSVAAIKPSDTNLSWLIRSAKLSTNFLKRSKRRGALSGKLKNSTNESVS